MYITGAKKQRKLALKWQAKRQSAAGVAAKRPKGRKLSQQKMKINCG